MTDGCQMVALEKADTWYARGSVPGDARLNTEPQEHLILTCTIGTF